MTERLTQPLKWWGGKRYLAKWIISLMPDHLHYVEPYFGGGAVLLEKDPEGVSEVVNDIDRELMHFWRVIRNPNWFDNFIRVTEAIPFSEPDWDESESFDGDVEKRLGEDGQGQYLLRAVRFFVRCRQSRTGEMKDFAPLSRNRTRRGMNEQASAWLNAVEGLPAVHARLKRVVVLNQRALDVIRSQDGPKTLQYLDPPYLHETREDTDSYQHEMTREDHVELLETIQQCRGKIMISGYPSELYDDCVSLHDWTRHDKTIDNKAAGGKSKRKMTESVWCNF